MIVERLADDAAAFMRAWVMANAPEPGGRCSAVFRVVGMSAWEPVQ